MNSRRRAHLKIIVAKLEACLLGLNELLSAEQDAFDNIPEALQGTDSALASEEVIDVLQEFVDSVDVSPLEILV